MKINQKGLNLIKECEGLRLKAYKAVKSEKYYTIGYGHYGITDPNMTITEQYAEELLKQDLIRFEEIVTTANDKYHYNFNSNEFSALVSFAYNIGGVIQLTQNGKRTKAEIADAMLMYNKAGGQTLTGLTNRRKKERELFLTPVDEDTPSIQGYTESTTLGQVIDDVLAGKFGNGDIRKNNIYKTIQNMVNDRITHK